MIQSRKTYTDKVQVENSRSIFFFKRFSNFYSNEKTFINVCIPIQVGQLLFIEVSNIVYIRACLMFYLELVFFQGNFCFKFGLICFLIIDVLFLQKQKNLTQFSFQLIKS